MYNFVAKLKTIKMPSLQRILAVAFCLFLMLMLLIKPDIYIKSAKDGLLLFATAVLPVLFPFFFISTFLTKLGVAKQISIIGKKPFQFLFNAPPISAYTFTMSILSGYPVGAKLLADFYENNMLSTQQAQKCSSFCTTSNPVFILGTVGTIMLKDIRLGVIILISHYLSALINGLIYRGKKTNNTNEQTSTTIIENCDNILSSTIVSSTNSMLIVGGFICVFNIFLDALTNIGAFSLIANAFSIIIPQSITSTLLSGTVEMTRGCYFASQLAFSNSLKASLCCSMISFGGLAILAQCITFLSKCRIKVFVVILQKLTHSIISFFLCFLVCFIFQI